ncbi:thioesterase family protein [Marivirga atlantica]|jgi:acyl-CoA thioester hydrolase|uniref:Acyl-CoA thioesterase n=1 Tax=Marivirga atlantica TaxID=1548457 RepID=A0A937DGC5_9BACT|nr:thioesterase family protein [Marivirga atlantica]MBL0767027.1 acyl-CoA thioesterase [Marivirga atlantica]
MHININPENFTFSENIQVRWTDLDPLAHVNNSIYIQYFEIARGRYMLEAAPSWDWHKDMFLLVNVNCNYIKELKIGMPETKCWVRTKEMGNKSFIIEYMITTGKGTVHTIGTSTQVMFDTKTKTTIEIPDWLRKEINNYEKDGSVVIKS